MINKTLRRAAKNAGVRLTRDGKNGKRVPKTEKELRNEIGDHENSTIKKRAKQTKDMIFICKSVLEILDGGVKKNMNNKKPSPPRAIVPAFRPPPPPPPPPPLPLVKKSTNGIPNLVKKANYEGIPIPTNLMSALKANLNRRQKEKLKKKLNQNAKSKIA